MNSTLETVYAKLPVSFQNMACSYEGWKIRRTRYAPEFYRVLAEVEARSRWSQEEMEAYRDARLRAFVQHAAATTPYYKELFQQLGIRPEDIRTLADMRQLPIITKQIVREHEEEMLSTAIPRKETIVVHTSGTTGSPLNCVMTEQALHEQWAVRWRFRRWHGVQTDTPSAYFLGRTVVPKTQTHPPFWRYNRPGQQILFSSYHINPANARDYVEELRRRKPPYLQGYPSIITLIASYILESDIDLGYQVRWVFANSETVLPQQVDMIERAFGVRPKQRYAAAEAVAEISECEYGNLHVDEDVAATEFIPTDVEDTYRVVGTNFTNPAAPMLRYDIGDLVVLSGKRCSCGHPGRIVDSIDGRRDDYIVLRDGTKLGRASHIPKKVENIREAQIYQKYPGEIVIRVVRNSHYSEHDDQLLLTETRKRVGDDTKIQIEYVDKLQRSRNGKLRFVVSEIEEGQLDKIR